MSTFPVDVIFNKYFIVLRTHQLPYHNLAGGIYRYFFGEIDKYLNMRGECPRKGLSRCSSAYLLCHSLDDKSVDNRLTRKSPDSISRTRLTEKL